MSRKGATGRYAADFAERAVLAVAGPAGPGAAGEGTRELAAGLAAAQARRRQVSRRRGVVVPETLAIAVTSRCDLRCRACGVRADRDRPVASLPRRSLERVLDECEALGIARVALLGGEPLLVRGLRELVRSRPRLLFVVFTNGRAVDSRLVARWRGTANVAFFVNVTAGSSARPAEEAIARLRGAGLACGFSATVHAGKAAEFADARTYDRLAARGATFGLVLDYLPAIGATRDPLVVTAAGRRKVVAAGRAAARRLGLLLILAPEDEDALGGCGVAGRSLVHVDPRGFITPCPFVPFSPFRLGRHSLLDALGSDYFRALREAAARWEARPGSCAVRKGGAEFLAMAGRYRAS